MANPYFNAVYYLQQNPDVFSAGYTVATAWDHYVKHGANEANVTGGTFRAPNPWFDVKYYLANNPDLVRAGITPATALDHFLTFGSTAGEDRAPNATIAAAPITEAKLLAYAKANADLQTAFGISASATTLTAAQQTSLLNHFYAYGYNESRADAPAAVTIPDVDAGKTFTLTANADAPGAIAPAIDTLGTSGDDTYNGVIDTTSGSTLGTVDSIDGQAGTDSLNARIVTSAGGTTVAPVVKNVEIFNLTNIAAAGNFTLNFASIEGEQQVWSKGSVAASDTRVVGVTAGTTAGLDSANGTYSVNYAGDTARTGTADAFSLAVVGSGITATPVAFNLVQANGTTIDASFEVANINATGAASNVTINGGAGANGLRVINVTGDSAGLRLADAGAATSLRTVDASGMTGTGGLNLNASTSTQTNFKFTGSGQNDRLVLDNAVIGVANTVSLNAGEGKDTLAITGVTNFAAAGAATLRTNVNTKATGFEVLEANANNVTALKANDFTNINEFAFTGTTQTAALNITGVESADKFVFSTRSATVDFDGAQVAQVANAAVGGGVTFAGTVGALGTDNSAAASGVVGGNGGNGTAAVTFGSNITSLTIESTGTTANVIQGGAGGAGGQGSLTAPGPANGGVGGNGAVAIDNNTEVQTVTITGSQNLTIGVVLVVLVVLLVSVVLQVLLVMRL